MKTERTKPEKHTEGFPGASGTAHRRIRDTVETLSAPAKARLSKVSARLRALLFPLLLLPCLAASAATTRYVWPESSRPGAPFATWATAAHAIQDAVDAAVDGDTVVVSGGVYATGGRAVDGTMTNRVVINKPITVQSLMGPEVTLIVGAAAAGGTNGDGAIRCVYLGSNAALSGFTLTNGHTRVRSVEPRHQQEGGGVWCVGGVVTNCILVNNSASRDGGGAADATLYNCILAGNTAEDDGGAADESTLWNCILTDNQAGDSGGGADESVLFNCVLNNNRAHNEGGGAYKGTARNSMFRGNTAGDYGGGAERSTLFNCTLTENSARWGGGAAGGFGSQSLLYNCIVYHNRAPVGPNYFHATFNYSCTTPLPAEGTGNIAADPQLASWSHLSSASPCIGVGSALYAIGVDIDGEPWSNLPCMGADQLTPGAATGPLSVALETDFTNVAVNFAASFKMRVEGQTTGNRWDFGDGTSLTNRLEAVHAWSSPGAYPVQLTVFNDAHPEGVTAKVIMQVVVAPLSYVNAANPSPAFPYSSWATAATNIQDAIAAGSVAGRIVQVTNGVYDTGGVAVFGQMTNRIALTNGVVVRSVNGPEVTILRGAPAAGGASGEGAIRCAYVGDGCLLDGFTLTNGSTRTTGHTSREQGGGGAWCERNGAVTNCIFTGNEAFRDGGGANGGMFYACTFRGNRAQDDGGGVDDAVLYNCILRGNLCTNGGGGASESILNGCTLIGNLAYGGGGADYSTLDRCSIADNSAEYGGGALGSTVYRCTLTSNSAALYGGGAYGTTLSDSTLNGNSADLYGGGAAGGTLSYCTLTHNSAASGGGVYGGFQNCTLYNCTLTGNLATSNGGGAADCTLNNCVLTDNSARDGGGAHAGMLKNCLVSTNFADGRGGGARHSTLYHCTIVGNQIEDAEDGGSGLYDCALANCIAYYNGNEGDAADSTCNYCCIGDWRGGSGGIGNIRANPRFVDHLAGDFHLQSDSPCINAGNNGYVSSDTDLDGNPRIVGGTVDMGAYEFQSPAGVRYVNASNPNPAPPYTTWATAAREIQDAVEAARPGDTVLVTNGVYATGGRAVAGIMTNRLVIDRAIAVRSVNGPEVTLIEGAAAVLVGSPLGDEAVRCVYLASGAALSGFTLTNGHTRSTGDAITEQAGGGAWCEPLGVLTNCIFAGNSARYGGGVYGGVLYHCTLTNNSATYGGGANNCTLHECTLIGNSAYYSGGGADSCTLSNCNLTDNSAWSSDGDGGGVSFCNLNRCTLTGNYAGEEGGGARDSTLDDCTLIGNASYDGGGTDQCTLTRCIIIGNTAYTGGGPYGGSGGGVRYSTLDQCIVVGNTAGDNAGADSCDLVNCTVTGNTATSSAGGVGGGGGAFGDLESHLTNCIVYGNTAPIGPNYGDSCAFGHCCTTPFPTNGISNITNEPVFVDLIRGNLRLQSNSPCINAGNNAFVQSTTDLAGNPRILGGTADIGAYEFQAPASLISYAWLQQYGLPLDGSADTTDPDGDRLNNWQEWRCGTDPTNALSALRLMKASPADSDVNVTWQSVAGVSYFLERSTNLTASLPFLPLAANLTGQAGKTSFTDTNAAGAQPRFYRVGVTSP